MITREIIIRKGKLSISLGGAKLNFFSCHIMGLLETWIYLSSVSNKAVLF